MVLHGQKARWGLLSAGVAINAAAGISLRLYEVLQPERGGAAVNKNVIMVLLSGMLLLTGCSQVRFIANGKEFTAICEQEGLSVTDTKDTVAQQGGYRSLKDAYLATPDDDSYSVQYARFEKTDEAQSYYNSIADQMNGEVTNGPGYTAEIETVGDTCREICMTSGRIVYAEGDTETIKALTGRLVAGWDHDPEKAPVTKNAAAGKTDEGSEAVSVHSGGKAEEKASAAADTGRDGAEAADTGKDRSADAAGRGADAGTAQKEPDNVDTAGAGAAGSADAADVSADAGSAQ